MAIPRCLPLVLAAAWLSHAPPTACAVEADGGAELAAGGLVASVCEHANEVGQAVLAQGGNAVDAAVATAFALAVTWPEAGNIGGGGFMLVAPSNAEPVCIEYREAAPAAASAASFRLAEPRHTARMVGVPGTVRGLASAHERFGKLTWGLLVAPAARLARDGFAVSQPLADSLNEVLADSDPQRFAELHRVFRPPAGRGWRSGDRLVQPELAQTLERLGVEGPAAFYTGELARRVVAESDAQRGWITLEDLAGYRAQVRRPVAVRYRGADVYAPPPPSSGGIALAEMLNILEHFDLRREGRYAPATLHLMAEAMRRAYCDRARWLGDPDFAEIPAELISKPYAARLAAQIDPLRATPSHRLAAEIPLWEPSHTTHFSVLDAEGMGVANTYTLEQSYGARIVVRGGGFLLNNEMGDFNLEPGRTDRHGAIGTPANLVAPGKRMLSSQCPCIVRRDGRTVLVTGSPGGRTIINTVLCVVLNLLEFEMDLADAVSAPRMHHAWFPDRLFVEAPAGAAERPGPLESATDPAQLIEALRSRGHDARRSDRAQGDAHSIAVDPADGRSVVVFDYRIRGRLGTAAGSRVFDPRPEQFPE